ncbi:MAG: recombinase family protein [Oscillospiraceae bacterium]|nr:recombinase family protein [Oscillospiraceae bacterium]
MKKQKSEREIAFYTRGVRGHEQLGVCREYAGLFLGTKEGEGFVFSDEGSLGDENLPGLAALRGKAQAGELRAVVCAELCVLCRSGFEFVEAARFFEGAGVSLIFVKDRIDLSSAIGRTLLYTAEMFSSLERGVAAANIRENMRTLARTGRWLGGVTPTGYDSRRVPGQPAGEKAYRLELNPAQAKTIALIYQLFLEMDSLSKVTAELAKRKVATKNGRAFSRFTVRQILGNPVYMRADQDAYLYFKRLRAEVCSPEEAFDGSKGMMVYNKTAQHPGQTTQQREISEWIVAVGEHEGIISGAEWVASAGQLFRNKSKTLRKPKSDHGLLAELLICGDCGAHMRPKLIKVKEDGEPSFSYLCERKEQSRSTECDMLNLSGRLADAAIDSVLQTLDPSEPDLLPSHPQGPLTEETLTAHKRRIAERQAKITENEEGISGLVFSLINAIDKSAYEEIIKQIDLLHDENAALRQSLEEMEAMISHHPLDNSHREALGNLLENWSVRYRDVSMARKRAALRSLVDTIRWDGEELLVKFVGGAQFAVKPY